jgi:hypothetical protein
MASELGSGERSALLEALDDEYRAFATYDQVVRDFGPVRPFINIRAAEARHIEALLSLLRRYGMPIPENPWPGRVAHYASIHDACAAGVAAEIANRALYQRLFGSTSRPQILTVFRNLSDASEHRHLPAFQRCLARGNGGRTAGGGRRCGRSRP